jgi:hypothetical protein
MYRIASTVALAAVLVLGLRLAAEEEKGKPRPQKFTGMLSKVEGASLTITTRGDGGDRSETFTTDAGTKILIETELDETVKVKGEGGDRDVTRQKTAPAKLADLKVGQCISVVHAGDKKASEVTGHRPPKVRKEGEK